MGITFHTILGSLILVSILFYVVRVLLNLNKEGFAAAVADAAAATVAATVAAPKVPEAPVAPASPTGVTQTCPGLSPVASAAALAADNAAAANAAKAADIAKITSKVVADNLAPQLSMPPGLNITCPSGDKPVITDNTMRNTKFSAEKKCPESMFDESCGSNDYNFNPNTEK